MNTAVRPSPLVTLWSSADNTRADYFVCTGVLVAPRWVLTVAHAVPKGADGVWIRAVAEGLVAYRPQKVERHDTLDLALLELPRAPDGSAPVGVGIADSLDKGLPNYQMHGAFRGNEHAPISVSVLAFEAQADPPRYQFTPKQPPGYSGAPLLRDGKVWGIATEHYSDPNTFVGCLVGLHQATDWLSQHVLQPIVRTSAETPAEARTATVKQLRAVMRSRFAKPPLSDQAWVQLEDGVPQEVRRAIASPSGAEQGRRCVEACIQLARLATQALVLDELAISVGQRAALREALFEAMGLAAKLSLNEAAVPGTVGRDTRIVVDARVPFGAMLVVRERPQKSWATGQVGTIVTVEDRFARILRGEIGDGEPAVDELKRHAWASISPDGVCPDGPLSGTQEFVLASELFSLYQDGRAFCAIFLGDTASPQSAEVQDWARQHQVTLVQLNERDNSALFLVPETELHAYTKQFLSLFQNPVWPGV